MTRSQLRCPAIIRPIPAMTRLTLLSQRLVRSNAFELAIVAVILINAALLGLGTSEVLDRNIGGWIDGVFWALLAVFIAEAALKMAASEPRVLGYFRDGWNVFDFLVIVAALIPTFGPLAMIARLARLLRVLRLISTIKELRLIVAALVRSIPSVGHVLMLMSIIVYVYAIIGYYLFNDYDPENWGSLGTALLTLFKIITLEGWTDILDIAMDFHPLAWMYFLTFVVVGTFVVINLFIAIIVNSLDDEKVERLRELDQPVSREELLSEIRSTQEALLRLERRLDASDAGAATSSQTERAAGAD